MTKQQLQIVRDENANIYSQSETERLVKIAILNVIDFMILAVGELEEK